jgi:1-acyl-sn-glycerol-3-phosphate acyltransferase
MTELFRAMSRALRVLGTGSAFALFGVLGILLTALVFPVVRRLPGPSGQRETRSQRVVHYTFRAFVAYMRAIGLVDLQVRGRERLGAPGGRIVVANHPTLLDVVMLGSLLPQLDCVVKSEAWSNPFLRGVVSAAGYIPNDAPEVLVDRCAARLSEGRVLLLFPEGTRSPAEGLGPLKRGAAHAALQSGSELLPVLIRCEPRSLMRDQPWYRVPEGRMHFTIDVGQPMRPDELLGEDEPRGAAARRVTAELRDFYMKRLQTRAG